MARGAGDGSFDDRLAEVRSRLTPAERRVAEVLAADRAFVAFSTVAEVAARSGSSGSTVVRLAGRLGYDGYPGLQSAVREELSARLRPSVEKIRMPAPDDVVGHTLDAATAAVRDTLGAVDPDDFARVVRLLSARGRAVYVACGDASAGLGVQCTTELSMLRPGVSLLAGNEVALGRMLAGLEEGDVVVALDLRRYDRWVLDTVERARRHGAEVVALTDSVLSPLAGAGSVTFIVSAEGVGPFDSYVGALALLDALVAGVAQRLRGPARAHLDRIEEAWRETGALGT